ncbi:hypothetical protein PMZ80_006427 [Knufia obscura]|uniref:Methyltransferase domain-containing protein n=2 Tax=Knufia TaxID=430999 RepID=A0AAN8EE10_9EURO|nr:hypothetical protein PMZ80_006427 [Knufia obscura]KAK5953424.1 hypothetical protein OHC33_005368 [Knufia fluminis]
MSDSTFKVRPEQPLPIDPSWRSSEEYVESLLAFVSTSELFRNLCGGVHVLDFLTRKPDLYSWVLPEEWRVWFEEVEIEDVLDLLLREDLKQFRPGWGSASIWRGYAAPPKSLIDYVDTIRRHSLRRDFSSRRPKHDLEALPRHVAVGMRPKKIHEVGQFAGFVDNLSQHLAARRSRNGEQLNGTTNGHAEGHHIQHNPEEAPTIIDFGSGQNYLGRTLACPPYNDRVIAIEQRHHNVEGAKGMDVSAKLAKKQKKMINKKEWKVQWEASKGKKSSSPTPTSGATGQIEISEAEMRDIEDRLPMLSVEENGVVSVAAAAQNAKEVVQNHMVESLAQSPNAQDNGTDGAGAKSQDQTSIPGSILYVEKALSSGDLTDILGPSSPPSIVVSIHSCGNLTHHGLRAVTLNPSVRAVAVIGCCYNLLTERLGPPTFKLPNLRSNHPRLEATSTAFDPHGFPMSKTLEDFTYPVRVRPDDDISTGRPPKESRKYYNLNGEMQEIDITGKGVRLNITARMMAVQAPQNWGPKDSEDFFKRHYYRALLQRILLDLGVVKMSTPASTPDIEIAGGTLSGKDDTGSPLIIGSLRKACFANFHVYVQGAIDKLVKDPVDGMSINEKTRCLFENDDQLIKLYKQDYAYAKKHLSIIWSLMAFSAGVVESTILVDRWLWLQEQEEVEDAWIEAVFDYKQSPRNMVVVGIKKGQG